MKLFNVQDDAIHATIRNSFAPKFQPHLREGKLYSLTNFRVAEYKTNDNYRPIKNNNKIVFLLTAIIKELEETEITISRHKFDFVDYKTIIQRIDNNVNLTGTLLLKVYFWNKNLSNKNLIQLYLL